MGCSGRIGRGDNSRDQDEHVNSQGMDGEGGRAWKYALDRHTISWSLGEKEVKVGRYGHETWNIWKKEKKGCAQGWDGVIKPIKMIECIQTWS